MKEYQKNLKDLNSLLVKLAKKDRQISVVRLISIVSAAILFYQFYLRDSFLLAMTGLLAFIAFGLLIKLHTRIKWNTLFTKEKISVNENELAFLNGELEVFRSGEEFIQHDHPYSYDLDFFGKNSLYQSLNRTITVRGQRILAEQLKKILPYDKIINVQDSVKELSSMLDWRQDFLALSRMNPDSNESMNELRKWCDRPPVKVSKLVQVLTYVLPIATLLSLGAYLFSSWSMAGNIGGLLFLLNLGILGGYAISLKKELVDTTKIEKILKQYALLLKKIEQQPFQSPKLLALQRRLLEQHQSASSAIHKLGSHFGRLEHLTNAFANPVLNGLFLFHIHVLVSLSHWRKQNAAHVEEWLNVIGEIEMLNSLANFSYNNRDFVYPQLNSEHQVKFAQLGHPLIQRKSAVTNSIDFSENRFFILTGSNMSGKSTFLRTIGVNMILGGIGAPVFAKEANIHPLPVLVSMRLSDSLSDSESYFYAEVKRLKSIMEQLEHESCFVLLDEILRGTNSDDKRNGTVEVIRKMATKEAYGGIATHDLEVCKTTEEFPDILSNKRFEVEIVDDELVFDYKLREGICENKSASFIMKKMGVI